MGQEQFVNMRLEGQFKGDFSSLKTFRRPSLAMETGKNTEYAKERKMESDNIGKYCRMFK